VNEQAMRKNLESLLKDHARDSFGAAGAMIESALAEWAEAKRGTAP
jgi:hypothetical protein